MAWVRIDDHYDEHPKFSKAGPLGMALWLAGLAYCNRNLTDGFIPWSKARTLLAWEFLGPETNERGEHKVYTVGLTSGMAGDDVSCEMVIGQLIYAGLWEEVDGGFVVHDYLDYQPSKEDVQHERARNADRQARHRASNPGSNSVNNARSNGVTHIGNNTVSTPGPVPNPNPVPNPVPKSKTEETPSLRSGGTPRLNGAAPRGNLRVMSLKDAFRERGLEPAMSARDYAAVKQSTAPPGLIAETYLAVADRDYGDDFMRKRLSVHEAIEWVNGYCEMRLDTTLPRQEELDRLHELGYNPASAASRSASA